MLYFLYGDDTKAARDKLVLLLDSLKKKKPDASVVRTDVESFEPTQLAELIGGQGLFEHKLIIVCDGLFEREENQIAIVDSLKEIADSDNVFLCVETKIDAKTKKKIDTYAEKVQEFSLPKQKNKNTFNIFDLADALGERNGKKLWMLYQKGRLHNVSAEEMHGILLWSMKNILLAHSAKDIKAAGLNPFVFKKASAYGKKYSKPEALKAEWHLVDIFHRARRGEGDLATQLELFTLSIL